MQDPKIFRGQDKMCTPKNIIFDRDPTVAWAHSNNYANLVTDSLAVLYYYFSVLEG